MNSGPRNSRTQTRAIRILIHLMRSLTDLMRAARRVLVWIEALD
jgi:hypothetical protein